VVFAGILQFLLGVAKAGSIGHFFPAAVIKGMLAGIGLILILKQLPHAVGYDVDFEGDESFFQKDGQNTFSEILTAWEYLTPGAMVIAVVSILLLLIWDSNFLKRYKYFRSIPAPLGVVVVGISLNWLFSTSIPYLAIDEKHLVSVPQMSESNGLLSFFVFPDFTQWLNPKVYYTALTIAIVASLETLLCIEACDKLDPMKRQTPLNQELKAQGAANFLSGMLGALPVTSVIVRSSTNINSGARTKASAISHGVILLISFLIFPNVLQMIPLSCLAGILIIVGYKLTNPSLYKSMYSKGLSQFLPFIVTVLAVTFTNLLQGVIMGIVVAIFFILRTNYSEAVIMVNDNNNYLLTLSRSVSFLNKATLRNKLQAIPNNSQVVIDGSESLFIDSDIRETLEDFVKEGISKNIQVDLKKISI
jgi:MFS superfamily sulfate permease-like transporter